MLEERREHAITFVSPVAEVLLADGLTILGSYASAPQKRSPQPRA